MSLITAVIILNLYNNIKLRNEIQSLEGQIMNIQNSINGELGYVSSTMDQLKADIKAELEKQASILSQQNIEISYDEGQMQVALSAVPKEYNGEEIVKFIVDKEEVTATNEGGVFIAKLTIEPRESIEARVKFINGDNVRQEVLTPINISEEFAIQTQTLLGDSLPGLEPVLEKDFEKYKNTLILSYYSNSLENTVAAKNITAIIKDRNTEKIIAKLQMEKPSAELRNIEYFKGAEVAYSVDLSEYRNEEGQYEIFCDLTLENGLHYYFSMATFENYKNGGSFGTSGEYITPIFE